MKKLIIFLMALGLLSAQGAPPLPEYKDSYVSVLEPLLTSPDTRTLAKALHHAELEQTLSSQGPYTLFAPIDIAFTKLPPGAMENWLKPENKTQLARILNNHIIPQKLTLEQLQSGELRTLAGESIKITRSGGIVTLGEGAAIVRSDILCGNGVVHFIDSVLLP